MSFIELIFEKQGTFLNFKVHKGSYKHKIIHLKYHLIYELAFHTHLVFAK